MVDLYLGIVLLVVRVAFVLTLVLLFIMILGYKIWGDSFLKNIESVIIPKVEKIINAIPDINKELSLLVEYVKAKK